MLNVKLVVIIICMTHNTIQGSTDYCEICRGHTLCQYPVPGPGPKCRDYDWAAQLSSGDVTELISRINEKRNFVASGFSRHLPQAANMRKIVWSEELARFAQRWADQCDDSTKPDKHDICRDLRSNKTVGQTIATISGPAPGVRVRSFVDIWFMQTLHYNRSISYYNRSRDSSTNDLTQLIWAETEAVGCGKARFLTDSMILLERLVCNFARRGNKHGFPVYAVGFAASQCPENTAPDREFRALCSAIPGSTPSTTEKFIPKLSPVSSLLRILNLSNNSVIQEIDPIKNSVKQSKVKGNGTKELRNQKLRHIFPETSNETRRIPYLPQLWTSVINDTAINIMALHQLHQRQEKGHSRVYHGHSKSHDFTTPSKPSKEDYNNNYELYHEQQAFHDFARTSTMGSQEANLRKYDFTTKPYSYSTVNARKCNQNQCGYSNIPMCTRRQSPCHATCETPASSCVHNRCPKAQNCNQCNNRGGCQHKPPCQQPPPLPPPPPPPPPHDPCGCPVNHPACTPPTTRCICNKNCQCLNPNRPYQRYATGTEDKEIIDETRRDNDYLNYDKLDTSIPSGPRSVSIAMNPQKRIPWLLKRNKKSRAEIITQKRKQILNEQVKSKLQYTQYINDDGDHSYGSFDSSVRKKREADGQVTLTPVWPVHRYNNVRPTDKKSLIYTTLLPNRRNNKSSRRTTISIVTEPLTVDIQTTHQKHIQHASTDKYLSFEELMHLRKMSPENYNGRRNDPSTEKPTSMQMTMPAQPSPKKRCTRKITCTWTMATFTDQYGSAILVFDNGELGPPGDGGKTPFGYVEGCSRTSTCTRDYMERNVVVTLPSVNFNNTENGDGDGDEESKMSKLDTNDDDEEYCERRNLEIQRRNLGDNSGRTESGHDTYSESPLYGDTTESIPHQRETITEKDCSCNRNRPKRDNKKHESMSASCCNDKKTKVMTYGDLHYLILRKFMRAWKTNNQSSQGEHKCLCNQSSTMKHSSAISWIIAFLFTLLHQN